MVYYQVSTNIFHLSSLATHRKNLSVTLGYQLKFDKHIERETFSPVIFNRGILQKYGHHYLSSNWKWLSVLLCPPAVMLFIAAELRRYYQNTVSPKLCSKTTHYVFITTVLVSLHLLLIKFRIPFKILLLTYKALPIY